MMNLSSLLICFSVVFLIHSSRSVCIPSSSQCGCSTVKPLLSQSKIVGGYTARSHSWPWMVSLRRGKTGASLTSPGSAFCGGALIHNRYVLSAAHCFASVQVSQLPNYFAVFGAQYKNETNSVRFTIKSAFIHENYNSDTYENDIALLELAFPVTLNDPNIGLICLPPENVPTYPNDSMNTTAIGWGRLEEDGSSSYTLQQVQLPVISYTNEFCANAIDDSLIQFCAGFVEGGKDTCQGDSGGPVMVYDSISDTWNLAGITSSGAGCAVAENPGVYTRVSMFVDWISARINEEYLPSQATIKTVPHGLLLFLFCKTLLFCDNVIRA